MLPGFVGIRPALPDRAYKSPALQAEVRPVLNIVGAGQRLVQALLEILTRGKPPRLLGRVLRSRLVLRRGSPPDMCASPDVTGMYGCSSAIDGAGVLAGSALLLIGSARARRQGDSGGTGSWAALMSWPWASGRAVRPDASCPVDHAVTCGRGCRCGLRRAAARPAWPCCRRASISSLMLLGLNAALHAWECGLPGITESVSLASWHSRSRHCCCHRVSRT